MKEAAAWNADMIVIGTHGYRGVQRLILGSVAENVICHATVPVLIVPPSA
jgi:nucleotide-binding universal stress UspA family protein